MFTDKHTRDRVAAVVGLTVAILLSLAAIMLVASAS
jgi:hypothetical protein